MGTEYLVAPRQVDEPQYFYSHMYALPFCSRYGEKGPRIGCVRMEELGQRIGLENLWCLVSGWSPDNGAEFSTGSFKELEALGVLARVSDQTGKVLAVSSAGNAGKAFLEIGAEYSIPAVIVVPESALYKMRAPLPKSERSPLLLVIRESCYPDAIEMVSHLFQSLPDALVTESGCYNVARRDAIGVLAHSFFQQQGFIPDHYVQAVGSATGAIAVYEAFNRILGAGLSQSSMSRIHLVQNEPFTPIVDAWNRGMDRTEAISADTTKQLVDQAIAKTLSNPNPPYHVRGGIRDVLQGSGGCAYAVDNKAIEGALRMLNEALGMVCYPEAGAALAGLMQGVAKGTIGREESVLLHVTGGGAEKADADFGKEPYPVGAFLERGQFGEAVDVVRQYLDRMGELA